MKCADSGRGRLFLLRFPGYFDGDLNIGIYDDVEQLKRAYNRVVNSEGFDEFGYWLYLQDPHTPLTIEEFNRETERFTEIKPEELWNEAKVEDSH